MRRLLLIFVLLIAWARPASAAITLVQSATSAGNDATTTFSAAPSASNVIVMLTSVNDKSQTISITGWDTSVSTLVGPVDQTAVQLRGYAFCAPGDGNDTAFVTTTSGGGTGNTIAVELAGAESCASLLDDSEFNDTSGTSHALTTDLTTTQAGDFVFAKIRSSGSANFTADAAYTSIPAGDTELNTTTLSEYKIAGAAGEEDTPFTSAASEDSLLLAIALKEAAAAGTTPRGMLLGVLP